LPVRFTEGFNPHPRISIVVPRPVGVASQCEAIVIEFERPVEHDDLLNRLRRQAPRGLTIQDARILQNSERLAAQTVRYRLELTQPVPPDVAERVGQMNNVDKIEIERVHGETGRSQRIDIRPYVSDVRLEKGVVEFSLRVDGQGSAKPSEVAGLLGFDPHAVNHRICRLEIQWK
jgi:radical SAM-linked protein